MPFLTRFKELARSTRFDYIILILAFTLSCVIRFKPVVEGTFPFLYDHGRDMLDVQKIVEKHDFTLIGPTTGLKGLFHGPLHYYLLSVGYVLSGGHPASGVVMVVALQLLGGVLCYFLGRRYISRGFGLILALLYLLSYVSVNTSVMFWNPYWIPFFMVLFYFSLLHALQRDTRLWVLVGFLAGIIAQFEIAFGVFLIPVMFFSGLITGKKSLFSVYFWLAFLAFIVPSAPLILFDFLHQHIMLNSIVSVINGSYIGLGESIPFDLRLDYRLHELLRFSVFAPTMQPFIAWPLFGLTVAYLSWAMFAGTKEERQTLLLFVLVPLTVFSGFMVYDKPAWSYYWIGVQVSYYFFIAYGLSKLSDLIPRIRLLLAVLLLIFCLHSITIMTGDTSFLSHEPGIYRNQIAVIDAIYEDAHGTEFGTWVYTPPIYDHTYRYLFSWRGKSRGFVPSERTDRDFYLIIESNKDRPWEQKGWKETKVQVLRKPDWTRSFEGDITLEKYSYEKNM